MKPLLFFLLFKTTSNNPFHLHISTCCSVKLSVGRELKSSPLMFYLCILQPLVSPPPFFPPLPYLSSLSRQKGTHCGFRAVDWLSWRLSKIVCLHNVCLCSCVSHAIMEAVSEPGRLVVSCLSNCGRQFDQHCCFSAVVRLKSCKDLLR